MSLNVVDLRGKENRGKTKKNTLKKFKDETITGYGFLFSLCFRRPNSPKLPEFANWIMLLLQ